MAEKKKTPTKAELLAHIRETYLFKDLDEEVLQDLSKDLTWVSLESGENLFRLGDVSDSTYLVIDGLLDVAIPLDDGEEQIVGKIGAGQLVGEMGVFTGQARTASIYAHTENDGAGLVKIPESGFSRIASDNPYALAQVGDTIRQRLFRNQLAEMLPSLFGDLDEETFNNIEAEAEWVQVSRGDVLIRQGDPGDSMYILIRGRLQARITDEDGNKIVVGEVTPGESVGEMAMFTGETRTADVAAVRDTALVKFSKDGFDRLMDKYPHVIRQITNVVIGRLRRTYSKTPPQNITNIAVVPIRPDVPLKQFTDRLVASLNGIDSTILLSSRRVDSILGVKDISQADADNPLNIKLTAWLDEHEAEHRFVVYQVDHDISPWTQRAVRQADRILLVGQASDDPAQTLYEARVDKIATVRQDLVLLYPDSRNPPQGTIEWLNEREIKKHYHVRWNEDGDFARLARFLAGKAVGLCLGGGGARGFAHFGVIRTLQEAGLPIDIVGGNSMGAYVSSVYATGYAQGWDLKTMIEATRKIFARWHYHITPPISSMFSDGILVHDIRDVLGETQIEDLWLPFFCVSSNLTRAEVKTHLTGDLWRAVRTSGGLPAIVPPVVFDGDLHVDGALLNNLPIDVMSQMCDGGTVIAIDVSPIVDMGENTPYGDTLSGWDLLLSKVNPLADEIKIPTLPTIMQRSAEIGAVLQLKGIVEKLTDMYISMPVEHFDILGFGEAEKIVRVGYNEAQRRIVPWLSERGQAAKKQARA